MDVVPPAGNVDRKKQATHDNRVETIARPARGTSAAEVGGRPAGLVVEARAIDLLGPKKDNLLSDELFLSLLKGAREGEGDASHAGPRCGTFSAARWNSSGRGPSPVTSKTESIWTCDQQCKISKTG